MKGLPMDAASITAIATPAVAVLLALAGIGKSVVDRHLAALTKLEQRSEANTAATVQVAATLDAIREHLVDLRRGQERIARHVVRLLDHAGLGEHEPSTPEEAPPPIPRGRAVTGSYPAVEAQPQPTPRG